MENARADLVDSFQSEIVKLCTLYLTESKRADNSMECAVGNFHVRNGATLWRINFGIEVWIRPWNNLVLGANKFDYGMKESLSVMVNYRYYNDKMWQQALDYQTDRTIAISDLI